MDEHVLKQRATAGDMEAAFELGMLLRERQPDEAARWWRSAAKAGDPTAAYNLAVHLHDRDPEEALRWGRQAASTGDSEAALMLGGLLEHRNLQEAIYWWRNAASADDSKVALWAAFNLAQVYLGKDQLAEAEYWFRRVLKGWDARAVPLAAFNLGVLVKERDSDEAERLWRLAAQGGHIGAAFNLALLLRDRGAVEEAKDWFERVVDASDSELAPRAAAQRAELESDPDKAQRWHQRAAEERGVPPAMAEEIGLFLTEWARKGYPPRSQR